jgi:biotin transporter BioY
MCFLGGFVYFKYRRPIRTQLLVVIVLVGTVLVGLGGAVSLSIVVPFVYILAAAGIGLLLDRWYTVFPRNPIAQSVGIGLVSLTVLASCWYGYRHYFVAWPAAAATQAAFSVSPPPPSDTIKK